MNNLSKQFKVISFLWLLFCFFTVQVYSEHSRFNGIFAQFFMYGIFAAPVWLAYGWKYLFGEKIIPIMVVAIILALYAGWFIIEVDSGWRSRERSWLIIANCIGFLVFIIPLTKSWASIIRWFFNIRTEFNNIKNNDAGESLSVDKLCSAARAEIKKMWIDYCKSIKFKDDTTLAVRIDSFLEPALKFFEKKFPQLMIYPTEIFWLTTFTAILESGTHSTEQVNAAIAELEKKYKKMK